MATEGVDLRVYWTAISQSARRAQRFSSNIKTAIVAVCCLALLTSIVLWILDIIGFYELALISVFNAIACHKLLGRKMDGDRVSYWYAIVSMSDTKGKTYARSLLIAQQKCMTAPELDTFVRQEVKSVM